jgi:predicted amidohydrolase YtcJ
MIFTATGPDSAAIVAGAIAMRGNRITYVGPDSGAESLIGAETEVIDGTGGLVTPGFIDSHAHPNSGVELNACDLTNDSTPDGVLATVRTCAQADPNVRWIRGTGWQLPVFREGSPTASMLDEAVADRPAYLTAADGHSAWVNSRAIELAGLTSTTPDPVDGRIERDGRGTPSGTLRESAMLLVSRLLPPFTREENIAAFTAALEMASSFGITALTDANADSVMLEAYRWMDSAGKLPVRINAAQDLGARPSPSVVERVTRWRDRYQGKLIAANSAKIYLDGVIEAHTAALLEPYLDRPGVRGEPNLNQGTLDTLIGELSNARVQVHIHAIGDRAIRMALDAFERAGSNGRRGRHQIAHLELIDSADIDRFNDLGIIANFQPLWAFDDPYIVDLTIPKIGQRRARWLYPIRSMVASGAVVVAGSDWSVSSMNPLEGIQVGATRHALDAGPGDGWIPEERASLASLLKAYTANGAFARFSDGTTGTLEVGKLADLVLLDANLFTLPLHQISTARVVLTVMDGRVRYRRPEP